MALVILAPAVSWRFTVALGLTTWCLPLKIRFLFFSNSWVLNIWTGILNDDVQSLHPVANEWVSKALIGLRLKYLHSRKTSSDLDKFGEIWYLGQNEENVQPCSRIYRSTKNYQLQFAWAQIISRKSDSCKVFWFCFQVKQSAQEHSLQMLFRKLQGFALRAGRSFLVILIILLARFPQL